MAEQSQSGRSAEVQLATTYRPTHPRRLRRRSACRHGEDTLFVLLEGMTSKFRLRITVAPLVADLDGEAGRSKAELPAGSRRVVGVGQGTPRDAFTESGGSITLSAIVDAGPGRWLCQPRSGRLGPTRRAGWIRAGPASRGCTTTCWAAKATTRSTGTSWSGCGR